MRDTAAFSAQQFQQWMRAIGCKLLHTPEYHPQSNGLAERMVQAVKTALKCFNPAKCSVLAFIHRFLFVHRNTAQRDGKTPAEIMLGRCARCPILSDHQPLQTVLYRPHRRAQARPVMYLFRQGGNTALVSEPGKIAVTAHGDQLAAAPP